MLCVSLAVIWFLISRSFIKLFTEEVLDYKNFFTQSAPIKLTFGFLVIGCMALVSVVWYVLQDGQESLKRQTEAERLSKEAELFKLRQQLQPHFLFNSLNSINALIGTEPQRARTMIQQLSDFLRGTLKKEEQTWTTLGEEITHLELYLEIEKVRFGHRLSTFINMNDDCAALQVPAMLLQPVVENAIKFGLYDTIGEVAIQIVTSKENNNLQVQITNPFDPASNTLNKGTGFGLASVQRRLYLLFARNDLLQTRVQDNLFITTIKIPQPA